MAIIKRMKSNKAYLTKIRIEEDANRLGRMDVRRGLDAGKIKR